MTGNSSDYEDTMSHMARKYAHGPVGPIHMHVLSMTKSIPGIIHEESSVEDQIPPIFVTAKSVDSTFGHHAFASGGLSSSSLSTLSMIASPQTPDDSDIDFNMNSLNMNSALSPVHKQVFLDIFDEYFDESKEGDVDLREFGAGLRRLGIRVSNEQLKSLFTILLTPSQSADIDGENSNLSEKYLERSQFAELMSRRGHGIDPSLVSLQSMFVKAIQSRSHRRNSCITAEDAQQWQTAEVSLAEIAMRHEMQRMLSDESQKASLAVRERKNSLRGSDIVLQCDFAVSDIGIDSEPEKNKLKNENRRLRKALKAERERVKRRNLTVQSRNSTIRNLKAQIKEMESEWDTSSDGGFEREEPGREGTPQAPGRETDEGGFLRRFFTKIACKAEENVSDSFEVTKG